MRLSPRWFLAFLYFLFRSGVIEPVAKTAMARNDFVCSSGPYISRIRANSHTRVCSLRIPYLFAKIHACSCNSMVEFAEITECMFERVVRVRVTVYIYTHACIYVHICTGYLSYTCDRVRVTRFAIAHVAPPVLSTLSAFSFHVAPTIQFIRRIILGTIVGTEGGFQPSPFLFYLVVAPVGPFRIPLPTCLRWRNRHGRFEGAIRSSWFWSRTWLIVTSFPSSPD